jgi:hypothetical protein
MRFTIHDGIKKIIQTTFAVCFIAGVCVAGPFRLPVAVKSIYDECSMYTSTGGATAIGAGDSLTIFGTYPVGGSALVTSTRCTECVFMVKPSAVSANFAVSFYPKSLVDPLKQCSTWSVGAGKVTWTSVPLGLTTTSAIMSPHFYIPNGAYVVKLYNVSASTQTITWSFNGTVCKF